MNEETKQEASVPVQARVNIVALARLTQYWEVSGYSIKTMSQLVGWSIDLLCEILSVNNLLKDSITTVADANRILLSKRLYQRGMEKMTTRKIATAIRFEGIREEGNDPRYVDQRSYKMLHNNKSVEPIRGRVESDLTKEAMGKYNELFLEGKAANTKRTGLLDDYNRYKSEKVITGESVEELNRPIVREKMSTEEVAEVIRVNEEKAQRELDELNSLDLSSLKSTVE